MVQKANAWHQECAYAYFFESIKGVGARSIDRLYQHHGSYRAMYCHGGEGKLLKAEQKEAFVRHKKMWDIQKEYSKLLQNKIWCIPKMLSGYPEKLKEIPMPPSALFVKGKLPCPDKPAAAVIGARECSPYGEYVAKELSAALAKQGIQVISGMARGIDSIGQKAALKAGGTSFGVLGCGVDVCYPEENRELYLQLAQNEGESGLISELLPGTEPMSGFFPMRNRIISGLADAVIVVEAREKSGTFITVSQALDQGKDVYALPGRLTDPLSLGCNRLIGQGAFAVYDMADTIRQIRERFYPMGKTSKESAAYDIIGTCKGKQRTEENDTNSLEKTLLDCLDIQFLPLEEIVNRTGKKTDIGLILAALSTLECEGRVEATSTFYRKRMD